MQLKKYSLIKSWLDGSLLSRINLCPAFLGCPPSILLGTGRLLAHRSSTFEAGLPGLGGPGARYWIDSDMTGIEPTGIGVYGLEFQNCYCHSSSNPNCSNPHSSNHHHGSTMTNSTVLRPTYCNANWFHHRGPMSRSSRDIHPLWAWQLSFWWSSQLSSVFSSLLVCHLSK